VAFRSNPNAHTKHPWVLIAGSSGRTTFLKDFLKASRAGMRALAIAARVA
jgi:hypothetical protein